MENKLEDLEARQRFEAFKLGKGLPSSFRGHKPAHSRSHSRNTSISSVSSFSLPLSRVSITSSDDPVSGSPPEQGLVPSSRRNSHHRRRSSVSTRHESAEMMGMSLPDLPPSLAEDNVNLGEKDSIRRRALWALEGKPDVSYSKVEIPELSTPQMEKIISEFPTKPSFPPGSGLSNFSNKRDSFKLLSSGSSTKDQLHTLVEEEEEEDDGGSSSPNNHKTTESLPLKPVLNRPRPASLQLRPLSLTPEKFSAAITQVPSPVPTPSPRSGLRSLSLSTSATHEDPTDRNLRCRSFNFPPRSHLSNTSISSNGDGKQTRRSSISYITSSAGVTVNHTGLPTPEMTPNYKEQHFSWRESLKNSNEDEFFLPNPTQTRPLSASEQHFLVKSHNALLARITDLERALSMRTSAGTLYSRSTRPTSLASDTSLSSDQTGTTLGEPNDEILQLLADLKAERDEYKRDVDAWRERVSNLDDKLATMTKRIEVEKRETWIARSRVGLLGVEKAALEKRLECNEATLNTLQEEKMALGLENQRLQDEIAQVHTDFVQVKEKLDRAQQEIEDLKRSKVDHLVLAADLYDEDNCLARYEDDEESDISFKTSSSDSMDAVFAINDVQADMVSASETIPRASKRSLLRSWTFPSGAQPIVEPPKVESHMDKFFGCLEDVEDETTTLLSDPSEYSYERSKGLFSEALKCCNDDQDTPFLFPGGLAIDTDDGEYAERLPPVLEEEEEVFFPVADEDMFGEASGICITLTPAQDDGEDDDKHIASFATSLSKPPVLPPLEFDRSGDALSDSLSFKFSCYDLNEVPTTGGRSSASAAAFLSERLGTHDKRFTPPNKRLGKFPSLIPQAVASPFPIRRANISSRLSSSSTHPLLHKQYFPAGVTTCKNSSSVTNESHAMKICQTSTLDSASAMMTRTLVMTSSNLKSSGKAGKQYTDFYPSLCPTPMSGVAAHCQMPDVSSSTSTISSRLSLQSLTTLIPSWTHRIFAVNNSLMDSPTRTMKPGNVDSLTKPLPKSDASTRKYVSKEVQLEKLRLRLESESLVEAKPFDSHCKMCYSKPILL